MRGQTPCGAFWACECRGRITRKLPEEQTIGTMSPNGVYRAHLTGLHTRT